MKLFSCQNCGQLVYFESVSCTNCGYPLGYAPERGTMCALEAVSPQTSIRSSSDEDPPASETAGEAVVGSSAERAAGADARLWRVARERDGATAYRLCKNQTDHAVCNWLLASDDQGQYCRACRLNHIIPNLDDADAKQAWYRMEVAKRRVLYTLYSLDLPVVSKLEMPDGGLEFEFLQDPPSDSGPHVYTGHSDGVITINIAEADDPFREKTRIQMGETYRTLLGHFRHEIGHYYWDRLIKASPRIQAFRDCFGDERQDYASAQQRHYAGGAPADWPMHFVSAYASMHPWEDWAEAWAHYLHIVDTLETARSFGVSLRPSRLAAQEEQQTTDLNMAARRLNLHSFDDLIAGWIPLTLALNALNRSMGLNDVYPFVLSEAAIRKLRFVHDTISQVIIAHETPPES